MHSYFWKAFDHLLLGNTPQRLFLHHVMLPSRLFEYAFLKDKPAVIACKLLLPQEAALLATVVNSAKGKNRVIVPT